MAEQIRIHPADLARIEAGARAAAAANKSLIDAISARQIDRIARDLSEKITAGVSKVLGNFEEITRQLGISDPDEARRIRTGLETVHGATLAAKETSSFLALLPLPPQLRVALLGAAAAVGALEGAHREETRRRLERARAEQIDDAFRLSQELDANEDAIARYRAARARARRFRK